MTISISEFELARANAAAHLLSRREPGGHWTGRLSSSALSTATAITALGLVDLRGHEQPIARGVNWLIEHQNQDGGWGDTVKSFSNISTTALCWAALPPEAGGAIQRAEQWLARHCGAMTVDALVQAIVQRYGKDHTFSVPILTMCALRGKIPWQRVARLPFELAALPQGFFRFVNLRVVSYALPALIAIGQVVDARRTDGWGFVRTARGLFKGKTLRVLERIQPSSGGFLEATPLTSFVTMSLAGMGLGDHPVARRGVEFLLRSMRQDGSWPIDTNLATWVTTLAVNALAGGCRLEAYLNAEDRARIRDWLLGQQYRTRHPYTGAAAGGWAWTDLPGGVPDADDTAGALLALHRLDRGDPRVRQAAQQGVRWLQGLQNRDGGVPTFCRGWGRLPFDQSCCDITAHAMRAWTCWNHDLKGPRKFSLWPMLSPGLRAKVFLDRQRRSDGSWHPLWFGNQHDPQEVNRTYGTSRVAIGRLGSIDWLASNQNADGGWGAGQGTPSTIEETALAVEAMAGQASDEILRSSREMKADETALWPAIQRGVRWLIERTEGGRRFEPSPIGFYFAKLWYFEELYPVIFTVGAMEKVGALWAEGMRGGSGAGGSAED